MKKEEKIINSQSFTIKKRGNLCIPISYVNGLPVVECKINGIESTVVLDTGAHPCGVFENVIEKLNINHEGMSEKRYTPGGFVNHKIGNLLLIEFGEAISVEVKYPFIFPNSKKDVEGIVGTPLLKNLKANIDFRNDKLSFENNN